MKTRESRSSGLVVCVTLAASALWGCAQVVGISDLDAGGGGGGSGSGGSENGSSGGSSSGGGNGSSGGSSSGSSSGSGSGSASTGGPAAFAGSWTASGSQNSSCNGTTQLAGGTQAVETGPGASQVTLPIFGGGCTLVFNVTGTVAQLVAGQGCSGTDSTTGDQLLYSWTSGGLTLDSSSKISASLAFTETDETTRGACTFTLDETFVR